MLLAGANTQFKFVMEAPMQDIIAGGSRTRSRRSGISRPSSGGELRQRAFIKTARLLPGAYLFGFARRQASAYLLVVAPAPAGSKK